MEGLVRITRHEGPPNQCQAMNTARIRQLVKAFYACSKETSFLNVATLSSEQIPVEPFLSIRKGFVSFAAGIPREGIRLLLNLLI